MRSDLSTPAGSGTALTYPSDAGDGLYYSQSVPPDGPVFNYNAGTRQFTYPRTGFSGSGSSTPSSASYRFHAFG
ncbi:MAG: hypothetical protein ABI808_09180 [Pseudonocardiales bacterium]